MKTKKANMSMIIEMEEKAFNYLIDSINKHGAGDIRIKTDNVYYEAPEIQSISDIKMDEIDNSSTGIEKREFDNYTVGEVIDILSKFPKDYEFLCCGMQNYAIWVDNDFGMVSIDTEEFINKSIDKLEEHIHSNNKDKENI